MILLKHDYKNYRRNVSWPPVVLNETGIKRGMIPSLCLDYDSLDKLRLLLEMSEVCRAASSCGAADLAEAASRTAASWRSLRLLLENGAHTTREAHKKKRLFHINGVLVSVSL